MGRRCVIRRGRSRGFAPRPAHPADVARSAYYTFKNQNAIPKRVSSPEREWVSSG